MKRINKIICGFTLLSSVGALFSNNFSKSNFIETSASDTVAQKVSFVDFAWQNTLWGCASNQGLFEEEYEPNPKLIDDGKNAIPQSGYLTLLRFSIEDTGHKCSPTDNFAYDQNYMFSEKVYVNGVKVKNLEGIKINNLMGFIYIYVPEISIQNKDYYQYLTVEFDEGIEIGAMILPKLKIEFRSTIGKQSGWTIIRAENKGIVWNKENKNSEVFGDKKGLLVSASSSFCSGNSENIINEIGDFVTFNNVAFNTLTNAEIKIYDSSYIWLYADEMANLTNSMNTITMEQCSILNETFAGFTYYSTNVEGNLWNSKISNEATQLELKESNIYYDSKTDSYGSAWPSNNVYEGTGHHEYCGGDYDSGKKNGYLLSFATRSDGENVFIKLSKNSKEYNGNYKYINLAHEEVGKHIKSNGVPFYDIDGAEIMYHSSGNIWFYTPTLTVPAEGKNHSEITIEQDTLFFDTKLPAMTIVHADEYHPTKSWSSTNLWHILGLTGKYAYQIPADRNANYLLLDERTPSGEGDTWLGPYTWNNHDGDGTTIFAYGANSADVKDHDDDPTTPTTYLKNGGLPDMTNLCSKDYSIGNCLTLNGMPLYNFEGCQINYQSGENFLSVIIPPRICRPFNGYKVPTLKLRDGTNFHDVSLQGFEVYWRNGKWQKAYINFIDDEDVLNAACYSDLFTLSEFNKNTVETFGTIPSNNGAVALEFRSSSNKAAFSLNLFGSENENGLNLLVDYKNQQISLTESTNKIASIGLGAYDVTIDVSEWTRLYVKFVNTNNRINFVIAIDDVVIYEDDSLRLGDISKVGNKAALYCNGQDIEFRNASVGSNIKLPTIYYLGKMVYRYNVGDKYLDIKPFFTAYDNFSNITNRIVFDVPEDMLDSNNCLNKGTFYITATVTNNAGTSNKKVVTIIVTDPNEAVVTFNGENPQIYSVGSTIEKPTFTPTKESNGYISYEFVCWTKEDGVEWDFQRDYVVADMNLIPLFKEVITSYTVTFNVDGENASYSFIYTAGATVSSSIFEKDGYDLTMILNDEEITSFVVNGDTNVTLKYTCLKPEEPAKKGCASSIMSSTIFVSLICGASSLLVIKKRKEDK